MKEIERNPEAWARYVKDVTAEKKNAEMERQRHEINSKRLLALEKNAEPSSSKVKFGKSSVSGGESGSHSVKQADVNSPEGRKKLDAVRKTAANGKAISPPVNNISVSDCTHLSIYLDDISHVSESPISDSSDIVLPNGSGDLKNAVQVENGNNFIFLLDITLQSLRASEKSLPCFNYSKSPPAEWTYSFSYILSSDSETTPIRSKKNEDKPPSADKMVGTGGVRKSKRLLEKDLNITKTGRKLYAYFKVEF